MPNDRLHVGQLGAVRDPPLLRDEATVRGHRHLEMRRGWGRRELRLDAAPERQIVHRGLALQGLREARLRRCRDDDPARVLNIQGLTVQHQIIEGRVTPVDAVELPGPLSTIVIHDGRVSALDTP